MEATCSSGASGRLGDAVRDAGDVAGRGEHVLDMGSGEAAVAASARPQPRTF